MELLSVLLSMHQLVYNGILYLPVMASDEKTATAKWFSAKSMIAQFV
jgi:hypothetical protein